VTLTNNKYCALSALKNESDVEQFFVLPILTDLGYSHDYLDTKVTVTQVQIGKGKQKKLYYPDYLAYTSQKKDKPVLVVDAKAPDEPAENGVQDAQLYASVIRRKMASPKPDQYCIGTNGNHFIVKHYDSDDVFIQLSFDEFQETDPRFILLKSKIGHDVLKQISTAQPEIWSPLKPTVEEIKAIFQKCHNRIWKRESLMPTAAFYEFTKLIFLKLREDERLRRLLEEKKLVTRKDLYFHTEWIDNNSDVSPNPVNSILFHTLVEDLEDQVRKNKKKPIFAPNEQINLKPSTIRSVVELLQEYDLAGIDEDLNGRMFEVFLSAAVRGKNLGAFFTPRNIIELMVGMASPTMIREGAQVQIETVLDGCCGSGGFLIDVMATMLDQIHSKPALLAKAKDLQEKVLAQHIYGIDSNPDIARIARINMFLHGDGGSRIYRADTLDKDLKVELGEARAVLDETNELRDLLLKGKRFDVVLTNPPFASSYSSKDEHEKRIISQYTAMHLTAKPKLSAKSNI
jgi:type I restriction enzyme M protein